MVGFLWTWELLWTSDSKDLWYLARKTTATVFVSRCVFPCSSHPGVWNWPGNPPNRVGMATLSMRCSTRQTVERTMVDAEGNWTEVCMRGTHVPVQRWDLRTVVWVLLRPLCSTLLYQTDYIAVCWTHLTRGPLLITTVAGIWFLYN